MSKVKFLWLNLNLILILNQSCCFPSPFSLSLPPCLSVSRPSPPSLIVGIKEQWPHQRPVTTRVNGASHMCIHTHRHERQVLQLEMGVFGDLGWGY